ncbi:MAG TPA: protein phosphatase 2C domain-containing protein [Noviherbaspirillum sp.]|jgi:protein phosphatase|uniref:PP2C family protein-serine/threonine phosphatase n=1 Tax=Noviherbaspirillum sp. TaxID=1926288 RepID=UPI002F94FC71
MTDAMQFRWTSCSCSHVGLVRQVNEDACLEQADRGLWAVADGMGGHTLGDLASRLVVESLNQLPPAANLEKFMLDARDRLQTVNRQLRGEAAARGVRIIGSTVAALLAHGSRFGCLWAGDSRIYLYRDQRLQRLTRDHSQIEEMKARGNLGDDDVLAHVARNLITRAVGVADVLELDERVMELNDGDVFLLCSDGLSNEVSEQELSEVLEDGNCEQATRLLVDLALQRGGHDNISVVATRAKDLYGSEKTVLNPGLAEQVRSD